VDLRPPKDHSRALVAVLGSPANRETTEGFMKHYTTFRLRSAWGQPFTREINLQNHLLHNCDSCRPVFEATKQHIRQRGVVDDLVIATLERSELLPILKPLRAQKPDTNKEARVNKLFTELTSEQAEEDNEL
jgi:hypothetical protein